MAKILNWFIFNNKLKEKKLTVFSLYDVVRLFNVSYVSAGFFVFRNTRRGLLVRLKKSPQGSLYCLADNMPSQYFIANKIYAPSYVSFDTALSFYGIIPESIYAITSATTKATRDFNINNIRYVYHRIKKSIYTGYKPVRHLNEIVLIAEPEKALADYIYFVALKRRQLSYERWNLKNVKKGILIKYVKLFKRRNMLSLVQQIYADTGNNKRIY